MISHFDTNEREIIDTWLQTKFFIHENDFSCYMYKDKISFFCNTTSPVEAHNNQTKAKDSGVRPSYSTFMATKVLISKENYKSSEKQQETSVSLQQRPSWSSSTTAPHVTKYCEGLIQEQWLQRDYYSIVQVKKIRFGCAEMTTLKTKHMFQVFVLFVMYQLLTTVSNVRVGCSNKHGLLVVTLWLLPRILLWIM